MTALIVIIALLVLVGLYVWSTQRNLVSLDEKMKNAFGQINVQLKTRWDAVTNLVEMTKQYAKHEHDTLTDTMASIRQYEENVRLSRMVYNDSVTKMNMMVRQFPSNLVANMLGFTTHELLPEDPAKSEAPSVSDIFNNK